MTDDQAPVRRADEGEDEFSARKAAYEAKKLDERHAQSEKGATSPLEKFRKLWRS